MGQDRAEKSTPWQAAVAAMADDGLVRVVFPAPEDDGKDPDGRIVRSYKWDDDAGQLVETDSSPTGPWEAPPAKRDDGTFAYMKPSSKKGRPPDLRHRLPEPKPRALSTFPLAQHEERYKKWHRQCFYGKATTKNLPKRLCEARRGRGGRGAERDARRDRLQA